MKKSEPQNIGSVISNLVKKLGLEKKLGELDAVKLWKEVAGEKVAEISEAVKITDGRLIVRVTDPVWRQQLMFLKREYIASLNARLGNKIVKDIYLI